MANEFKIKNSLIINSSGSVNALDIQGSQGQLFSVTDSLSGSLFSVSDISGLPIIEVLSDDTVKMGTFANEALIVTGSRTGMGLSNPAAKLHVSGTANSILLEVDSVSSQNILFISGSGNVGINTNTPAYKLDVIGNGRFRGSGTTSATYGLQVHNSTGTNNALTVRDDGAVGIGTASPVETLTVNGSISANWGSGLKLSEGLLSIVRGTSPYGLGIRYTNTWDYYQGHIFGSTAAYSSTAAVDASVISIIHSWAPTAVGSTNYRPFANYYTINATAAQTGTVSGIYTNATQTNLNGALHYLINLNVNNSNKFRVDNNGIAFISGSLGIGTNAPAALLHISGSSSSKLFELDSDSVQNIIYVSGSGNVGIGTNNPAYTLDVSGTGRFTSGLNITGSVIVSGSSTFTNIGPAIFSGSVDVTGSITATRFIGDGSQLTGVATPTPIRRHDYSGSYSYCGIAPSGSSEASSVWSIDRIQVLNDGNVTITSASLVTWTGRYTHIYV